jgi:hypothetical protein
MKLFSILLPTLVYGVYLYHCITGMANGQHQVVGGASLEFHRVRRHNIWTSHCKAASRVGDLSGLVWKTITILSLLVLGDN